ncbi:medium-chain acyl-CoA ligase ACSF2, mitochondrial-like [Babylonia areolata]|uniref:medium-chain acyl-CoA ligase ACSF2, mitochondrial-like n=1 Tax=Babylonia areolata TaxID=304850 RepID=UPI003FD58BF2
MGCPGLVQVKGPQVSCPKNLQMTPDGWLPTGDVAFYNARHHLQAVCRTSKAIIHGPYIIYPGWLEKKLQDFPGVLKVVIVPVPDPKMFQEMCVCIVPHRGELLTDADIRTFCQTLFVDGPLECQQIPRDNPFAAVVSFWRVCSNGTLAHRHPKV